MDLIFNPAAGGFREARLAELIEAFRLRGIDASPAATTVDSVQLSGSADLICVLGGDGTLRDTVKAMGGDANTVPLCIAPSGTINLVARELGYAKNPAAIAAQISTAWDRGEAGRVRSPLFKLGNTPIVSCMSVGPDSSAVAGVSTALKRRIGRYAYVAAAMRHLHRWPRHSMELTGELANGTPFVCNAEMMVLSRGAFYAGPFRLSPAAGLRSKTIELITMRRSTRMATIALTGGAMARLPIGKMGLCEIRSVRRVSVTKSPIPVQIDGDLMPDEPRDVVPTGMTLTYCV